MTHRGGRQMWDVIARRQLTYHPFGGAIEPLMSALSLLGGRKRAVRDKEKRCWTGCSESGGYAPKKK